jgi:hypothetical protein
MARSCDDYSLSLIARCVIVRHRSLHAISFVLPEYHPFPVSTSHSANHPHFDQARGWSHAAVSMDLDDETAEEYPISFFCGDDDFLHDAGHVASRFKLVALVAAQATS